VLLVMACVVALVDLGDRSPRRWPPTGCPCLTLVVLAALTAMYALKGQTFYGFGGMVVSDAMANWLKCFRRWR
jgi:NADH-quinone oxidoreductase subunit N